MITFFISPEVRNFIEEILANLMMAITIRIRINSSEHCMFYGIRKKGADFNLPL